MSDPAKISRRTILSGAAAATVPAVARAVQPADPRAGVTVAAYYFPNYHYGDPRNEAVHGKGWAEWELVKKAHPRFPGHVQPLVPKWGYTDEADPKEMARKIDAAADNGLDAFIFDWYYYDDGPFLERGLDRGFLGAKNNRRLKFSLMWANHDWVDIHPKTLGKPEKLLYPGRIKPETWERMTDLVIERYFKHPSYWRIEGRPYFSVYELYRLVQSFGSIDATRAALDRFRSKVQKAGMPDLHLNGVTWGVQILPGEQIIKDVAELSSRLKLDSVTSYVWIHHVPLKQFPETPYQQVEEEYWKYVQGPAQKFGVPYYPNVTMGWDSSPRARQEDPFENRGYPFMASLSGNTPQAFRAALQRSREYLATRPAAERVLTVNCWNEWTEGSYLEPDTRNGMAYLEGMKAVYPPRRTRR